MLMYFVCYDAFSVLIGTIATSSVNVQATVTGVVVGLITIVGAVMILLFVGVVCYKIRKSNGELKVDICINGTNQCIMLIWYVYKP